MFDTDISQSDMEFSMKHVKIVSLEPGCYAIKFKADPGVTAIEFADTEDRQRSCRIELRPGKFGYELQLKQPLKSISFRLVAREPEKQEAHIEFNRVSTVLFRTRMLLAATTRNRVQNFGPGEKLLCHGDTPSVVAAAASANVEHRYLYLYDLDDESIIHNGWFWADTGWQHQPHLQAPAENISVRACVYIHMHYLETWPEIRTVLLNNAGGADIIVTTSSDGDHFPTEVRKSFPNARVMQIENRGRDIGPFVELLHQGVFDPYDAVCKIHGKLSLKGGKETVSGHRIRRYALACLLADGAMTNVINAFSKNPDLGIAGPYNLRLPPRETSVMRYLKDEENQIRQVFARTNMEFDLQQIEFFAGTMFWFRPAALKLLQDANFRISDFDIENGAKRNTLQHGLERLFPTFVRKAGYRVAGLQPYSPTPENATIEFL